MVKSKVIKYIHLFLGILLLMGSIISFPLSFTGFLILKNSSINLNFMPSVFFVLAVIELSFAIRAR